VHWGQLDMLGSIWVYLGPLGYLVLFGCVWLYLGISGFPMAAHRAVDSACRLVA
jgi:hypothetical protein